MSAFILSVIVRHNPAGQAIMIQNSSSSSGSIIDVVFDLIVEPNFSKNSNLRKWLIICLGNLWENNEDIRWLATRNLVYDKLFSLLDDPVPEVRAACVYAFGTFMNSVIQRQEHADDIDRAICSTLIQKLFYDSSPLVRKELLVTLHWFILIFEKTFLAIVWKQQQEEEQLKKQNSSSSPNDSVTSSNNLSQGKFFCFALVYNQVMALQNVTICLI